MSIDETKLRNQNYLLYHKPEYPLQQFMCHQLTLVDKTQKLDKSIATDKIACSCDIVPKLKQKAHRSFMQVMQIIIHHRQIQNLYKEEIQQLKRIYDSQMKEKEASFKKKEEILVLKCKQLEGEVEKFKQAVKKEKRVDSESFIENPFDLDSIDNIMVSPISDDSSEFIYNIRQLVQTINLKEKSKKLEISVKNQLYQIKRILAKVDENQLNDENQENLMSRRQGICNLEGQIQSTFQFIKDLIESTVQAYQKYNQFVNLNESKYSQIHGNYELSQRQCKFLSDHIKKLSTQKIKIERKCNDLERLVKSQEQNIKFLKKIVGDKDLSKVSSPKRDVDCLTAYNLKSDNEEVESMDNMLCNKFERKKSAILVKSSENSNNEKILPGHLNFKKKTTEPEKNKNKQEH